jgi:hypothetical protein
LLAEEKDFRNSLRAFRPKFLDDLLHLGRAFAGGYVVNERAIRQSRYLLSLNDDCCFAANFRDRKPDAGIFCFDYSVSKQVLPREGSRIPEPGS